MSNPRIKDSAQALKFWNDEIKLMKDNIEKLTGNKITSKNLKAAIVQTQKATKAFRRLQDLRRAIQLSWARCHAGQSNLHVG
jgi:benzoyl-CoA reductase/2-hydroxyglutaryl-CoA dehydratase subunit BcrC/BadD/HgdB